MGIGQFNPSGAYMQPAMNAFNNSYQTALMNAFMPQMTQEELLKMKLANQLSQETLPYAGPTAEASLLSTQLANKTNELKMPYIVPGEKASLELKKAQAKRQLALANMPFGGFKLSGPAAQIQSLEMIKAMYGEDSPQYKNALALYELQNKQRKTNIAYQDMLTKNPERFLSQTGKTIIETAQTGAGFAPGGKTWEQAVNPQGLPMPQGVLAQAQPQAQPGMQQPMQPAMQSPVPPQAQAQMQSPTQSPLAPASPQELSNQYKLLAQKQTTDTAARNRNLFATNIDKTIEIIDPDALTAYSGTKGQLELYKDKSLASLGTITPKYAAYQQALRASELLATQVRQFYGDSIQPSMIERLERLTNPSGWATNPQLAKAQFDQFVKILKMETKTYRDALKTPEAYQEQPSQKATKNYSDADIKHTAQKYGISEAEVRKRLGI